MIALWILEKEYPYVSYKGIAFKHRLLKFRCLGLAENIRQRKRVRAFLKEMDIPLHYKVIN